MIIFLYLLHQAPPTHFEVTQSLKDLSNDELIELGTALGLPFSKLKRYSAESLCDDMVHAWLRKDDDVLEKSGEPSWESLATALEAIGIKGTAENIRMVG